MQMIFVWIKKNPKSVKMFTTTGYFSIFPTAEDLKMHVTNEEKSRYYTKLHRIIFPSGEKLRREQISKIS